MGGGGRFCPICKIYWGGGFCPRQQKRVGGFCPGGILSGYRHAVAFSLRSKVLPHKQCSAISVEIINGSLVSHAVPFPLQLKELSHKP